MRKILTYTALVLIVLVLAIIAAGLYNMRDRHKGYFIDIDIEAAEPGVIQAGFAALKITPEITEPWNDVKGNARYDPKEGDSYEDLNGNGRFDAVWMAGFQNSKPAMGIHDDLWARAMVLDDGKTRIAWVAIDAIGLFGCDVIDIRKSLPEELGIDYAIVSATHTHSAPDLLGLWGPGNFRSGVDPTYKAFVKDQCAGAIQAAALNLRPARFRFAMDRDGAASLVEDTRKPIVLDPGLRLMQALDAETGESLGILVSWDNHPEAIWSGNLLISSDFPHYLRKGLEEGVYEGDSLVVPAAGGVVVYVTGNLGGLMSTTPGMPVDCPFTDTTFTEPSYDKVKAIGHTLAKLAVAALEAPEATALEPGSIGLRAKTVYLPLDNSLFRLGAALGIFDRGLTGWMKFRSEVAFWQMGPASFLFHPGELYPEIAYGGIESPEGQDFPVAPVEIPPLRELMPGDYRFITGLTNDMIGYIIPKSQWDAKPPYTYGYETRPYGEINSLGPETGPLLHSAMTELITGKEAR